MVILDYIKFKKFPLTVELSIYLIHGNPRNISNEIEHDILSFYKKCDYEHITYVVDDDADTENIKSCIYEQSLFDQKKILTLNIVSKSIPLNLKKFIEQCIPELNDDKIIIKIDRQASSFKKTNLYKKLNQSGCVIEIYELKGKILENWVTNKCKINNIEPNRSFIDKVIDSNFNNSLAISQDIYLRGLMQDTRSKGSPDSSKYTEYDLVDMFLSKDIKGFNRVSNYLQRKNISLSYIIFLMNLELEKIYCIRKPTLYKPYIAPFLESKYKYACDNYAIDDLIASLKNIVDLDVDSKYNSRKSNPWIAFNSLQTHLMTSVQQQ